MAKRKRTNKATGTPLKKLSKYWKPHGTVVHSAKLSAYMYKNVHQTESQFSPI